MNINVFEGARRIAKLVALIWVVGCVTVFTIEISEMKPHKLSFEEWKAAQPFMTPEKSKASGPWEKYAKPDEIVKQPIEAPQNAMTREELMKAGKKTGKEPRLVPLNDIPDEYLLEACQTTSKEQQNVMTPEEMKACQAASKKQIQSIEKQYVSQWQQKRWERIGVDALCLLGGVAFIWALTWVIGWIVRGFLGIPSGQDFKCKTSDSI